MADEMGHGKLTDLTSKEEQRPKEVVYVFRESSPTANELDTSDEELTGIQNDRRTKKVVNFESSDTILTTIPSSGFLDKRKRYVCEKEVETRIPVNNASTMAE